MNPQGSRMRLVGTMVLTLWGFGLWPSASPSGMGPAAYAQSGSVPLGTPFLVLPAADFQVRFGTAKWVVGNVSRSCDGSFCRFVHSVQLPHLSDVVGIELDACDNDDFNSIQVRLTSFAPHEALPGSVLVLIDTQASGVDSGCRFFLRVPMTPVSIDQFFTMNLLEVSMYEWTAGGSPPSDSLRFQAVRVYYRPNNGVVVPTFGTTTVLSE